MIEVQELTKRFGPHTVVDHLDFKVNAGEIVGFLGPNGAGKSTTMKMITGFLAPTSGTARIMGFDIRNEALDAKRVIGYLPEGAPAWGDMTVIRFLTFIAEVRGLTGNTLHQRLDQVVQDVHLDRVLEQKIETLSKGFQRRVGLAQALIHDPDVLILDEPTDGLDPNQKHEVRQLIRGMSKDKHIVISTHILEEVEAVCTRAIIISEGRILADDTPAGLLARSPLHDAVVIKLADKLCDQAVDAIGKLDTVAEARLEEGSILVLPKQGTAIMAEIDGLLDERGWRPTALYQRQGRLDEVFRDITGGANA